PWALLPQGFRASTQTTCPSALRHRMRPFASTGTVQHFPVRTLARALGLNPSGEAGPTISSPSPPRTRSLPSAAVTEPTFDSGNVHFSAPVASSTHLSAVFDPESLSTP